VMRFGSTAGNPSNDFVVELRVLRFSRTARVISGLIQPGAIAFTRAAIRVHRTHVDEAALARLQVRTKRVSEPQIADQMDLQKSLTLDWGSTSLACSPDPYLRHP
jgi:hypothetical protein